MIVFCVTIVTDDCVLYYNLQFDEKTSFPKVLECIRVDKELHVQLQFSGNPLPLPCWFVRGTNAKLPRYVMLINLAPYILETFLNRIHIL